MASSSPLVPERRVNKNGVVVTKHVRASSGEPSARGRALPGPAVAPEASAADEYRGDLIHAITGALPDVGSLYTDQLVRLETPTLEAIRAAAARPEARPGLTRMLQHEIERFLTVPEPFLQLAAHAMTFAAAIGDNGGDTRGVLIYGRMKNAVTNAGFADYDGRVTEDEVSVFKAYVFAWAVRMNPSDYRAPHFHARDVQKIADHMEAIEGALPALAASLQRNHAHNSWVDVEAALTAVQESGADPQALADFMLDRGTTDIRAAGAALRGITAPLHEGAL